MSSRAPAQASCKKRPNGPPKKERPYPDDVDTLSTSKRVSSNKNYAAITEIAAMRKKESRSPSLLPLKGWMRHNKSWKKWDSRWSWWELGWLEIFEKLIPEQIVVSILDNQSWTKTRRRKQRNPEVNLSSKLPVLVNVGLSYRRIG